MNNLPRYVVGYAFIQTQALPHRGKDKVFPETERNSRVCEQKTKFLQVPRAKVCLSPFG